MCRPAVSSGLTSLHEALTDLERLDPRKSLIVELKFFVGLSVEEIAEVFGNRSDHIHARLEHG